VQISHSSTLDALRRVQGFLDAQVTALGALIPPSLRARLDGAVTALVGFQVEQSAAAGTAKGETANQSALRKDLRTQFMRPIARIAKASLKGNGDLPTLTAPSSRLRNTDFAGAAQALTDAAAKHEKTFTDGGMPVDFLTQLRTAIAQLAASKDAQDRGMSRRSAATQGITDTNKTAHDVLVVLDSVISPALKTNKSLLADWKASKKIVVATPLPPQPTGLPATNTVTPPSSTQAPTPTAPDVPAVAPAAPAPSTTPAAQTAKPAA
jgi:hypothetical protein